METSYTGVGAFSSSRAPDSNALAAASVIGNALKANNHDPNNLNLPKLQASRPPQRVSRAGSITSNARHSLTARSESAYVASVRNNSINTANARRMSVSAIPKQRLQNQKSTPNLSSRRSVSDLTHTKSVTSANRFSYNPNVPRTIKKYVPSATGLVAVEVPNPKHPDNINATAHSNNAAKRSSSIGNFSTVTSTRRSQFQQPPKHQLGNSSQVKTQSLTSKQGSPSITKNIKRETKILPNGTKVISTTVEEYINDGDDYDGTGYGNYEGFDHDNYETPYDDSYDDFLEEARQVDMSVTLDEIHEDENENENENEKIDGNRSDDNQHNYNNVRILDDLEESKKLPEERLADDLVDEIAQEEQFENEVKKVIENNERIENYERELAFKSADRPVEDTVVIEDVLSRGLLDTSAGLGHIKHSGLMSHGLIDTPSPNVTSSGNDSTKEASTLPTEENKDVESNYEDDIDEGNEGENVLIEKNLVPAQERTNEPTHAPELMAESSPYAQQESIPAKEAFIPEQFDTMEDNDDDDEEEGSFVNDITDTQDLPDAGFSSTPQYTEEDYLLAQKKLDMLVKQKEQEILAELERNGQIENGEANTGDVQLSNDLADESFDNDANDSTCTVDTDLRDLSSSKYDDAEKQVQAQEYIGPILDSKPPTIPFQSVEILGEDKFFTPPITPPVISNDDNASRQELINNASPTTASETQRSMTSVKRSQSPESSIARGSAGSAIEPLKTSGPPQSKSMAQHMRQTVTPIPRFPVNTMSAPSNAETSNITSAEELPVPKREASIQAQIDHIEERTAPDLEDENCQNVKEALERSKDTNNGSANLVSVNRRKSVLKNRTNRSPVRTDQKTTASGAYLSLATAENTKRNAQSSINGSSRRQSVSTLQDPAVSVGNRSRSGSSVSVNQTGAPVSGFTPLAAAAKAAQRHSAQPGSLARGMTSNGGARDTKTKRLSTLSPVKQNGLDANGDGNGNGDSLVRVGSIKAPNQKVEEAKRRILQNRPGKSRAKELYALSKTRSPMKSEDLKALHDPSIPRRSSFEKERENVLSSQNKNGKVNMTSISLRDTNGLNYDEYEKKKPARSYRSRFADDNSDTDIPLPPIQIQTHVEPAATTYNAPPLVHKAIPIGTASSTHEKEKTGFRFKLSGKKSKQTESSKATSPHKESKFEKFFVEPHGPGKRVTSTASAATESTAGTGKKKRGFFKKMFNDN